MISLPEGIIFTTFTRPLAIVTRKSGASPSAKIVPPFSYDFARDTAASLFWSSPERLRYSVLLRSSSSTEAIAPDDKPFPRPVAPRRPLRRSS